MRLPRNKCARCYMPLGSLDLLVGQSHRYACYFIGFVYDETLIGFNINDNDACSILLPVIAGSCSCPGEGCGCSLIHFHPSCSGQNAYRQVADSAT